MSTAFLLEFPYGSLTLLFFNILMQILYLSRLWLIFLSIFMISIVLLCALCGIIKKTDFITGEKRYVRIYYWK